MCSKIKKYVQNIFDCQLSYDEEAYLTLHIHRVTFREK